MLQRPSLRAVVATTASAALLVGGAQLASYAAGHHSHSRASASKSAVPKTITFTVGANNQVFAPGSAHLFTAKVPKGTYATSISGFVTGGGDATASYTCLLVDKKFLNHLLHHPSSITGAQRLYSAAEATAGTDSFGYGIISDHNPVAKVDRTTIVYGCAFNGTASYTVARPLEFTLTPVKADNQKGQKFNLPTMKARQLARALR